MTNEQTKQAINVIKQTLDQAIKIGVAVNLEQAAIITQAFQIINQALNNNNGQPSTNDN